MLKISTAIITIAISTQVVLSPTYEKKDETIVAEVTAYTSSEEETDDTPNITASQKEVQEGMVACPRRYEFGTKFTIEGKTYICEDRMHKRYDNRFDIWMANKEEAIKWGVQTLQVTIHTHGNNSDN